MCFPGRIKEKFPYAFDDICLYSEVSYLLAHCMFRLPSRRFIQELFQDVPFIPVRRKVFYICDRCLEVVMTPEKKVAESDTNLQVAKEV